MDNIDINNYKNLGRAVVARAYKDYIYNSLLMDYAMDLLKVTDDSDRATVDACFNAMIKSQNELLKLFKFFDSDAYNLFCFNEALEKPIGRLDRYITTLNYTDYFTYNERTHKFTRRWKD